MCLCVPPTHHDVFGLILSVGIHWGFSTLSSTTLLMNPHWISATQFTSTDHQFNRFKFELIGTTTWPGLVHLSTVDNPSHYILEFNTVHGFVIWETLRVLFFQQCYMTVSVCLTGLCDSGLKSWSEPDWSWSTVQGAQLHL